MKTESEIIPARSVAYTVPEVARILAVSQNTVRSEIAAGRMPAFRVRSCLRIPREAVQDYIDSQRIR